MTRIYVDSHELLAVGRTLENCATEVADLGSGLHSCSRCAMPAAIEIDIDRLMVMADAVLDEVAVRLYEEAIEIVERSILAARGGDAAMPDLIGSAAVIGGPREPAFTVMTPEGVAPIATGLVTIGGARDEPFVVLGADGRPVPPDVASALLGASTLGGHVSAAPNLSLGGGISVVGGSNEPSSDVTAGGHRLPMGLTHRSDVEDIVEMLTGRPTPTGTYVPGRGSVDELSLEHQALVNPVGYVDHTGALTSAAGLLHGSIPDALRPPSLDTHWS